MTPTTQDNDKYDEQQRAYREDREDDVHPIIIILGILLFLILFSALFVLIFVK